MRRRIFTFSLLLAVLLPAAAMRAQTPQPSVTRTNYLIEVTATTSPTAPYLTLRWPAVSSVDNTFKIRRRLKGSSTWGSAVSLPGSPTEYADATAARGVAYEYSLQATRTVPASPAVVYGAIVAGCDVPLVEQRGKVLLYIDETQAVALGPELDQLERNLAADGWKVHRHHAPRAVYDNDSASASQFAGRIAEREAMRATIRSYYQAEPGNDWALFIIGRAPVVYSGLSATDGHSEHNGAWATDAFYADVDGPWSDTTANNTQADYPRNRNIPGDGKYDQNQLLSNTELQTGRVDLSSMDGVSVGLTETELLRQYLVRNHRFRRGLAPYDNVARRALIDDTFDGATYSLTGWQAAIGFFGNQSGQVDPLDWFTVLPSTPMLFAYGGGGGDLDRARDVGTSEDFATKGSKAVFTLTFGSWFADWDNPDNFLRAPLAGTAGSLGLTNAWSGIGGVHLYHMALGAPIGYSIRFTQNSNESPSSGGWFGGNPRHILYNLMGDPTLRLHTARPPRHVVAEPTESGVALRWEASPDATEGYHVYRSVSANGPFSRITGIAVSTTEPAGAPVAGTSWTDGGAEPGVTYTYLVKAVKRESTGSGTYFNQSLGEAATSGLGPLAPTGLQVVSSGTTSYQLFWRDNASNETGYEVERRDLGSGLWTTIATLPPGSETHTDVGAPSAITAHYRVRATGSGTPSVYAEPETDYLLPGAAIGADRHRHVLALWDKVTLGVRRFNGSRGQVSVGYSSSDVLGAAGIDYASLNGSLSWPHGDTADRSYALTLLPSAAPKLTRLLKIAYANPTNGLRVGVPAETFVQVQDPSLQTLPAGWSTQIIGSSGWLGYAEHKDGVFGISTRTSRFGWGYQTDSLRFVSVPVAGDCTLTARIRFASDEMNADDQPGLMLRASLAGTSAMRAIMMPAPTQVVQVTRAATNATASTATVNVSGGYGWLRVVRTGASVSTYRSTNGSTWSLVGTAATFPLSTTAYVGLFLSTNTDPNKAANPGYAQFDNVTLTASLSTPASLSAGPGARPGEIALSWNAVPGATAYEVERSLAPGSGFSPLATVGSALSTHTDAGLEPGTTYHYRVRAVGTGGTSAYSGEASASPYLPTNYPGWRYAWFGTNDTEGPGADAADPDADGATNIEEYAAGSSPLDSSAGAAPGVGVTGVDAQNYLTLSFVHDSSVADVVYAVESTSDLAAAWSGFDPLLPARQLSVQNDTPAAGRQTITVRDSAPLTTSPRRFMRLRRGWQDPVARVFSAGFEEESGTYVLNATPGGKTDFTSGTNWSIPAGWAGAGTISGTHPKSGARAWRLVDTSTSAAFGATLDAGPAVAGFVSSQPWTFRVSFSLVALPVTGGGNQFAIALGQATASSTGKQWFRFLYNNGSLDLMVRSAGVTPGTSATQTAVSIGQYTDFASLGEYVTLTLTIDPSAKRYTAVGVSGPRASTDATALVQAVNDGVVPWGNTTLGDPAAHLLLNSATPATLTLDFDDLTLEAAPAGPATP